VRHSGIVRKPSDCVGDARGVCWCRPYSVATIMFHSRAEVEAGDPMWCPRCSVGRLVVNDDSCAKGGDRMGFKVVGSAVETGVGRDGWIRSVGKKVIECELNLWEK
jgi:hypothetical protein